MQDLLEQGVAWLDGQRTAHLARLVTYWRGGESVELAATPGSTTYEVTDEAGVIVQARATDFIVSAAALVLAGLPVEPLPGDRIVLADGRVFEVMAIAGGEHFRPCGPDGRMLRIHTKQVGE